LLVEPGARRQTGQRAAGNRTRQSRPSRLAYVLTSSKTTRDTADFRAAALGKSRRRRSTKLRRPKCITQSTAEQSRRAARNTAGQRANSGAFQNVLTLNSSRKSPASGSDKGSSRQITNGNTANDRACRRFRANNRSHALPHQSGEANCFHNDWDYGDSGHYRSTSNR
jgi:hypothetical protein